MDYTVDSPADLSAFPFSMLKFLFITDEATVSFIVEDKFSEALLREELKGFSEEDLLTMIDIVKSYYAEDEIGQGAFSKVTKLAQIQRIL